MDQAFYNSSLNTNEVLGRDVQPFALTPSTGGTAIDAQGNIYVSDTQRQSILRVSANGTMETLVQDPRLLWVDAMVSFPPRVPAMGMLFADTMGCGSGLTATRSCGCRRRS